jgi:hypothetical protein
MARDDRGWPVTLVAGFPVMAFRLGVGFIRFQARRKRGVRKFRATLVRSGMPRKRAAHLAQNYYDVISIRKMLRAARTT